MLEASSKMSGKAVLIRSVVERSRTGAVTLGRISPHALIAATTLSPRDSYRQDQTPVMPAAAKVYRRAQCTVTARSSRKADT